MIELTGISLSERQRELNTKINDAARNKINFEDIKSQVEISDVDKLYKIGVASKYKNVQYITEILKSGDSLYISKALKCIWLYDNEYSHIINPEYFHENIFPLISIKMAKKILTAISVNVRDELRTKEFYNYCKRMKYTKNCLKFLLFIPEELKLQALNDENVLEVLNTSDEYLRLFIGNSVNLAEAYANTTSDYSGLNTLYRLRFLYFVSGVKYLEMLNNFRNFHWYFHKQFGIRISRDIMKKHKYVIYKNPIIYLRFLNKSVLMQYSTADDAKLYAKTILFYNYSDPADFWNYDNFCENHRYILNKIPFDQRMQFIKSIYTDQYPEEEFEMNILFYRTKLYKMMTPDDREKWALRQLESGLELLGSDKDFKWYKFIAFDKSFDVIKKYVMVTDNTDTRNNMLVVLVHSAKTETELEILFDYYYKRHVNEQKIYKEQFLDAVLSEHNVYNFSTSCWDAFNKILFSVLVNSDNFSSNIYKIVVLIYHVIHGKKVPDVINTVLDIGCYQVKVQSDQLSGENKDIVYKYVMEYYLDKIKPFNNKSYNDEVKEGVKTYVELVLNLLYNYNKSKEDIPEIVDKYINLDFESYCNLSFLRQFKVKVTKKSTMQYLIDSLKKDKEIVVSYIPLMKDEMIKNASCYELNKFLKMFRTYFSNDLATGHYLKFFQDMLNEPNLHLGAIKTAVYGILELGDNDLKKGFITKYIPTEAKINHRKIDRNVLYIQKSICTMASYCRPILPLSDIMKYIQGDYIRFCLPVFNSYMARTPKPLNIEITKSLLDKPLSILKHGIRLAFKCFSVGDLKKMILDVWIDSKCVSLRPIIYTAVINKINSVDENTEEELFEVLKSLTSSLQEDDNEKIFKLVTSKSLPQRFIGEYLEAGWNIVKKLPENNKFIVYKRDHIMLMEKNINVINEELIHTIIYPYIDLLISSVDLPDNQDQIQNLIHSKCTLLYKYISYYTNDDDFCKKADAVIAIIKECNEKWNAVEKNSYIYKKILSKFIVNLNELSYKQEGKNYARTNVIFGKILKELQDTFPFEEIYETVWMIRICIIARETIIEEKVKLEYNKAHNMKELLSTFAKKFANLLIESIMNRKCYFSLYEDIQTALTLNLRLILTNLGSKENVDTEMKNLCITVCSEILEFNSFEGYMFALTLLTRDCDQYTYIGQYKKKKKYMSLIDKLKCCEYDEIKCYIYDRFDV